MALLLKKDVQKMRRLAQEGKQISRILADDFPKLDYGDVYWAVYGEGERSSQGIKKMISFRIQKLVDTHSQQERKGIAQELNDLVWHLYQNHKTNFDKLSRIRAALEE